MIKARCDVNFFLLQWRIDRMMQLHFEIDGIPCVVTIKIPAAILLCILLIHEDIGLLSNPNNDQKEGD